MLSKLQIQNKRKFVGFGTFFAVLLFAVLVPLHETHAFWGFLNEVGKDILNLVLLLINSLAAFILALAGVMLNYAVQFTVIEGAKFVEEIKAIGESWAIIRDVANMLFIFIILFIGISVILRLGGPFQKKLLTKVIIAALLINFSLFVTRVVFDASNILTTALYQPIAALDDTPCGSIGSIEEEDEEGEDNDIASVCGIGGAFVSQMKLTSVFGQGGANLGESSQVIKQIMSAIFMFIAAFVFLFMALLLLIRFVVFVFLMITSPIAFIGGLLPALKKSADDWWKALTDQAVFAPVFMLMITIVYLIVSNEGFQTIINPGGVSTFDAALSGDDPKKLAIVFGFFIAIALLIGAIIISKKLASGSGGAAVGWSEKFAKGVVRGTVDKTVGAAGRGAWSRTKAGTRGVAGNLAEKLQTSEGKFAKTLRAVPGATGAAAKVGEASRKDIEEAQSRYKGYSTDALKNIAGKTTTSRTNKAAIAQILADRKKGLTEKGKFTPKRIEKAVKTIERKKDDAKKIKAGFPQYAESTPDKAVAIGGGTSSSGMEVKAIKADQVENLHEDYFDSSATNRAVRMSMYSTFHKGHLNKLFERNDSVPSDFLQNLKDDYVSAFPFAPPMTRDELADWIASPAGTNNPRLAAWARSNDGKNMLRHYGFS